MGMVEKSFEVENKGCYKWCYLKYDSEKYDIEYVEERAKIVLIRLKDHQVVEVFSDEVDFIIQCDMEGKTNFIVHDYSTCSGERLGQLNHYIDEGDSLLRTLNVLDSEIKNVNRCQITDSSYLIDDHDGGLSIYNLDKQTKHFHEVCTNQRVSEILGNPTVLVSEKRSAKSRLDIQDTIIYGMNPETLEVKTPIWSEMQKRYIPVYTKEQVAELKENLRKQNQRLHLDDFVEITIRFEVEKYLNEMAKYLDKPQKIDDDEFIKKFKSKS